MISSTRMAIGFGPPASASRIESSCSATSQIT
jgi:hypothetical protein